MAVILALIAMLWCAVLIARPQRPALDQNEALWLIYARHHGGWQRLFLTAVVVTLASIVIGYCCLIHEANSDLFRLRNACAPQAAMLAVEQGETCWQLDAQGQWHLRIH